ncbi:MAG: metallophosphoesterase [Bacillota bacterium]|nr:metallophosphoesterase [Bacillota bacterium]
MRIGVLSDTHRQHYMIRKAMEYLSDVDLLIHLGDNVQDVEEISTYYKGEVIAVRGNCDFNVYESFDRVESIGGKKFFITHGHNYNVKKDLTELKYKAIEVGADIALFGHTHISQIAFEEGIWFVNPGSTSLSRNENNSFATIDINEGKIEAHIRSL